MEWYVKQEKENVSLRTKIEWEMLSKHFSQWIEIWGKSLKNKSEIGLVEY